MYFDCSIYIHNLILYHQIYFVHTFIKTPGAVVIVC